MDARADHDRFRELVREEVRYRLKHHPVLTDGDWVIRCSFSLGEFLQQFPAPEDRARLLQELAQINTRNRIEREELAKSPLGNILNFLSANGEDPNDSNTYEPC